MKYKIGDTAYMDILEKQMQEPCDDTISRQAAIRIAEQGQVQGYEWQFKELVKLPPVTPQPKMGRWIRVTDRSGHLVWECDKCGWQQRYNTNFCPDCGQPKMQKVKE